MIDLFCGAGGTSTGVIQACRAVGASVELTAINHWDVAIETHSANHPDAEHYCESLDRLDPRKVIGSNRINLLVASPECTHHSNARGGRPMSDQSRASAFHVLRWLEALYVDNVIIENVGEFTTWGPLGVNGRPMRSKRGALFQQFIGSLKALGYRVEWRILNCADYGDATTRKRFFLIARRGNRRIEWPDRTHSPDGGETLFEKHDRWRPAREIIDWSLKGESIFTRKRPLAEATMRRIEEGLRRFGGPAAEPFLVTLRQHSRPQSVREPLPAITVGGTHIGLCEPFILPHRMFDEMSVDSVDAPLRTFTASNGGCNGLVQPFMVPSFGERKGQSPRTHDVNAPLPAVTSHGAGALVEPFVVRFNNNGGPESIDDPLGTLTTRDRFGLVEVGGETYKLDIRFRMLQPHELAAAMSFPESYKFQGNKSDVVKQIGNAVPVRTAQALCSSALGVA